MPRRHPFVLAGSISRVLYSAARFRCGAPVIYLRRRSPAASSNLPPDIGRATLDCRYTRSCNPRDVLPGDIAAPAVGSYPAFSPLPAGHSPERGPEPRRLRPFRECPPAGGRSLLRSHNLTAVKSLACVALCVARTFLSRPAAGSDRADLRGKDRHFGGKNLRRRRIFPPCGRRPSARPLRPGSRAVVFRLRAAVRGCALRSGRVCRACSGTAGRSRSVSRPLHGGARRRRSCRGRGSGPCPSCPRRRRAGARWRCA